MKPTKTAYTYIYNKLVKSFGSDLIKPQLNHFITIIQGMLFSSRKSIKSYAKSSNKDQSSINRFMKSKSFDDEKLKNTNSKLIKNELNSNEKSYLIIDDTIKHHQYAKKIFGIGRHHDHLEGGFSTGHSVVTAGIYQSNNFYPTNCDLYINESDVSETSEFRTKIDFAVSYINGWIDSVSSLLIDSWYASKEILKLVLDKGKTFFTMLKKDRNLTIKKKKRQVQNWGKDIYPKKFKELKFGKQHFLYHEKIGNLPKVGKIKVVFIKTYDSETKKAGDMHYLVTNDVNLSALEILEEYSKRWPIEVFHRDIKQNLGFEKSIIRNEIGVRRHLVLSWIAHTFLVITKKKNNIQTCGMTQQVLKKDYIEKVIANYGLKGENLQKCIHEVLAVC